jgi:bifunctional DNase/RNase
VRRMSVKNVILDPRSEQPVVLLADELGRYMLPIVVGGAEAMAISMQLEGTSYPRPLTHDLMKSLLEATFCAVEQVVVCDLQESVFYARVYLATKEGQVSVDARPSDAIALALRFACPILCEDHVLEAAGIDLTQLQEDSDGEGELDDRFRNLIDSLEQPPPE